MIHLVYPPKFYITIVFNFSWVLQSSYEKSKTMDMKIFFFFLSFFLFFFLCGGGGGDGGGERCIIFPVKITNNKSLYS